MDAPKLKKILLVDDDPVIRRLYEHALRQRGYEVETAEDGVTGARQIHARVPDAVVLDLMMPKMSGTDVLKFVRGTPGLQHVPVVVLSNAYMNDLAREALALGANKALLKSACNPAVLDKMLQDLGDELERKVIQIRPEGEAGPGALPEGADLTKATHFTAAPDPHVRRDARHELLAKSDEIAAALRSLHKEFLQSEDAAMRERRLENLWRKVHFISATAGMAECRYLERMATAFEALLFATLGRPDTLTVSVLKTVHQAVELLVEIIEWEREAAPPRSMPVRIILVDDDPVCSRLIAAGLRQIHFEVSSFLDPREALEAMRRVHYDLVLLDVEMPEIDGFELCRRLRELPGYRQVSVIFITQHSGFVPYSRAVSSGGDDMIGKPVFPMELVVKATGHMLRRWHHLCQQRCSQATPGGGS